MAEFSTLRTRVLQLWLGDLPCHVSAERMYEFIMVPVMPDRAVAAAKFLAAFATGYAHMEVRVLTPDQGLRMFLKTACRLGVDGVPYVAGFCLDVTDRKQTEDTLAREKAFSDALIESVPGAFFVVDTEGSYFRWNSYLRRLTGLSDRQLQGSSALLAIHADDLRLAAATMKDVFEHGYAQAELRVPTHDRGVRRPRALRSQAHRSRQGLSGGWGVRTSWAGSPRSFGQTRRARFATSASAVRRAGRGFQPAIGSRYRPARGRFVYRSACRRTPAYRKHSLPARSAAPCPAW